LYLPGVTQWGLTVSRQRAGTTSEESEELRRLRRENAELRRPNEILKAASAFFGSLAASVAPGGGSLVSSLSWLRLVACPAMWGLAGQRPNGRCGLIGACLVPD